jgi:hypothetical protein
MHKHAQEEQILIFSNDGKEHEKVKVVSNAK